MQVLHQNIGLDLYIFKTFLFFNFFPFLSFKIFYYFFLVKQRTPLREVMRPGK